MIILEGNIGAGKSTFLRLLAHMLPTVRVSFEPLQDWQSDIAGKSLLTNFYADPHRWAYTFETTTMLSRLHEYRNAQQDAHPAMQIVERSLYSGYHCFAYNSYLQGFLNDIEWQLYQQWFNITVPVQCRPPQGFIYIRCNPEIAWQRIQKRKRVDEETMPFSYIEQIHERHEMFLYHTMNVHESIKDVPVLIIDGNVAFEDDTSVMQKHVNKITQFMTQIYGAVQQTSQIREMV